jgi:hypothetical protein
MKIPPHFSFSRTEGVLAQLKGAGSYVLTASLESKYHALGGEAALVQAYVTWAQQEELPQLRLAAVKQPDYEEAVRKLPTLSFALLAERISFGSEDVSKRMRAAALSRLVLLQGLDPRIASRGPQIEIVCADHLGRSFPASLYEVGSDEKAHPKPESALGDLVRLIFKTTMAAEYQRGDATKLFSPLGGALYELFRNTHEHARHDLAGNFLARSLRVVHARRHSITPQALASMAHDVPPLADYCRRLRTRTGRAQLQLLELSVLDSGPGLAGRWLGRQVTPKDPPGTERKAVLECFESGASTKPRPGAGMGLPNLIAIGRKANGFLRLRTGAQSLYADLGVERDQPFGSGATLEPLHGDRLIARAAGTLWSLVLPINEVV